jgi:TM2 domain-containing membrane protein YozV
MPSAHSPKLAIFLSAELPGLGQFYNRQWAKGAGFLVATLVVDAAFGVTSEKPSRCFKAPS